MPDFINLTCPSCGGKLQITNDMERFACGFCGNEQIVRREGGTVSLAPVVAEVKKVAQATDLTASELAIKRLDDDLTSVGYELIKYEKAYKGGTGLLVGAICVSLASLLIVVFLKDIGVWCWSGVIVCGGLAVAAYFDIQKSRKRMDELKEQAAEIYREKEKYLKKVRGIE